MIRDIKQKNQNFPFRGVSSSVQKHSAALILSCQNVFPTDDRLAAAHHQNSDASGPQKAMKMHKKIPFRKRKSIVLTKNGAIVLASGVSDDANWKKFFNKSATAE
jgi:hypothetical protein